MLHLSVTTALSEKGLRDALKLLEPLRRYSEDEWFVLYIPYEEVDVAYSLLSLLEEEKQIDVAARDWPQDVWVLDLVRSGVCVESVYNYVEGEKRGESV